MTHAHDFVFCRGVTLTPLCHHALRCSNGLLHATAFDMHRWLSELFPLQSSPTPPCFLHFRSSNRFIVWTVSLAVFTVWSIQAPWASPPGQGVGALS